MKKTKILLSVLIVFALIFSQAACDGKSGTKESDTGAKKLENPDVTVIGWGGMGDDFDYSREEAKKWYEETYGGKVNYVNVQYGEFELSLMARVSAGNGPELCEMNDTFMPKLAIRKLIQPIDDYIDLKDPVWDISSMNFFKWNGKYHMATQTGWRLPVECFYNQTMFENNGIKTPIEYYNEGAWTYENFKAVAKELTQDTDKDGKVDQWGAFVPLFDFFVLNNGGRYVSYDDSGSINVTMNSANVLEGLQFFQDGIVNEKFMSYYDADGNRIFIDGRAAMIFNGHWFVSTECANFRDKLGIAPAPVGPNGKKGDAGGYICAFSFGVASKNPEGAGYFITKWAQVAHDIATDKYPTYKHKVEAVLSPEVAEVQKMILNESTLIFNLTDGLGGVDFWGDVLSGVPPATAVEKSVPLLQAKIDTALKDRMPTVEAFTAPAPEDFESGTTGIMTAEGVTPTSADVTKDAADIIGGAASLKIIAPDAGGFIIRTDETKVKLPSYHVYKVTFDYKVIKAPAAGGSFVVLGMPKANMADWAKYYGYNQMPELKDGDTGIYTCNIAIDKESADNVVLVYNTGGGTIVIDNFKIEE